MLDRIHPSSQKAGGLSLTPWLAGALLCGLAVAPYLGVLDYPLQHDDRVLIDNPWLAAEADAWTVFGHDYWFGVRHSGSDLYRPITILSLAWNQRQAPSHTGFHAVNLLLHALTTLLVWLFLTRLQSVLMDRAPSGALLDRFGGAAAWSGAALFAVHPLASESVIFAVGRADLMATGFGLAAIAIVMTERRVPGAVALSAGLFGLALFSKESAAAWLLVLALWWLLTSGLQRSRAMRAFLAWVAVFAGFLVARASAVGWMPHTPPWVDNPLVAHDALTRMANAILVFGRYLARMVFPRTLSISYEYDQISVLSLLPWALPLALALILAWLAVACWLRRLSPAALFLWVFIPLGFAVTGNLVFPIGTIFAERLAYMPLVGACGLAGLLLWRVRAPVWLAPTLLLLLLAAGITRTVHRTYDFASRAALVEATAADSPRAVKALANLGRLQLRSGHPAEAIVTLERAVAIWPDYSRALRLLSDAHRMLGRNDEAERYLQRASEAYQRWTEGSAPP